MPFLGGVEKTASTALSGAKIFCDDIGYVQYVDMPALQAVAKEHDIRIMLDAMPGSFLAPGRSLVTIDARGDVDKNITKRIANAFVIGAAAADADDRIVYNSSTGQLFYDADGNGALKQVQFATLDNNAAITRADFVVI